MRTLTFIIFTVLSFQILAQSNFQKLQQQEYVLDSLLKLVRATDDDQQLDIVNNEFKTTLAKTLEMDSAFYYPFNRLQSVGKIYSEDKLVRIFSWNLQYNEDLSYNYFSFIMKKDERRGNISVTELKRRGENLKMSQYETIEADNWYGALYYEIIDIKKGRKTYYTLLGFDGYNNKSSIKFLDVLYFTGNIPHLGYPLFKTDRETKKRLLFEYSARATMSMRYDKERDMIIMDHLSPEVPKFKEFREFYVPDLSYDGYKYNGKAWELEEDIIAINEKKSKKLKLKAYDSALDTVVDVPVKNEWEDPTDVNTPIDSGTHRATMPEMETDKKGQKKQKKEEEQFPYYSKSKKHKRVSKTGLGSKPAKRKKR